MSSSDADEPNSASYIRPSRDKKPPAKLLDTLLQHSEEDADEPDLHLGDEEFNIRVKEEPNVKKTKKKKKKKANMKPRVTVPQICAVKECGKQNNEFKDWSKKKQRPFSIHRIPTNDSLINRVWLRFCCGGPNQTLYRRKIQSRITWGVCSKHFLKKDRYRVGTGWKLVDNAIPCLHSPDPENMPAESSYCLEKYRKARRAAGLEVDSPSEDEIDVEPTIKVETHYSDEELEDDFEMMDAEFNSDEDDDDMESDGLTLSEVLDVFRREAKAPWTCDEDKNHFWFYRSTRPSNGIVPLTHDLVTIDKMRAKISVSILGEEVPPEYFAFESFDKRKKFLRRSYEHIGNFISALQGRKQMLNDDPKATVRFVGQVLTALHQNEHGSLPKRKLEFLADQLEYLHSTRAMEPSLVRLAAAMRTLSPNAYELLKNEEIMTLPTYSLLLSIGCPGNREMKKISKEIQEKERVSSLVAIRKKKEAENLRAKMNKAKLKKKIQVQKVKKANKVRMKQDVVTTIQNQQEVVTHIPDDGTTTWYPEQQQQQQGFQPQQQQQPQYNIVTLPQQPVAPGEYDPQSRQVEYQIVLPPPDSQQPQQVQVQQIQVQQPQQVQVQAVQQQAPQVQVPQTIQLIPVTQSGMSQPQQVSTIDFSDIAPQRPPQVQVQTTINIETTQPEQQQQQQPDKAPDAKKAKRERSNRIESRVGDTIKLSEFVDFNSANSRGKLEYIKERRLAVEEGINQVLALKGSLKKGMTKKTNESFLTKKPEEEQEEMELEKPAPVVASPSAGPKKLVPVSFEEVQRAMAARGKKTLQLVPAKCKILPAKPATPQAKND